MQTLFEVIAEDDEFLVINKPAGLVCHPTKGDEFSSLISRVRLYFEGSVAPHLINRLDRETSGIVVVGKSVEAAARLRKQWESRQLEKRYQAIVHGHPPWDIASSEARIGPDEASEISIKDKVVESGSRCLTRFRVLKRFFRGEERYSLLQVTPETGRKHQIRIHLSHAGYPIVGDKLYGRDERLYLAFVESRLSEEQRQVLVTEYHALHAGLLTFEWFGVNRTYFCPPEPWFRRFAGES